MPLKKNEKNERNERSTNQGSDRQAAFERAKAEVEKRFGDRAIQRLGDASSLKVDVISTQSLGIDIATGVGGVPRGRITEIYGPESSGKTLFCLHVIAEAQKQGGTCVLIDAENAFDVEQARSIGVDVENLHVSQPESGEAALEIAQTMIASGSIDVLVVDSAAALVSRAEIEGDMGDSHVGLQARLMSQAMRKLSSPIKATNTAVIFTNQLREKVGVMFGCLHGDTLINFVDGRAIPIKKVVDNHIEGLVWAFDEEKKKFVPARIVDWHNNGEVSFNEDYISIETESVDGANRFFVTVTPDHKILTKRGWVESKNITLNDEIVARSEFASCNVKVLSIENASDFQMQEKGKYDISVENYHNYLAGGTNGGIIVHNSPETTPGGRALKFYASVRLDIRRIETLKDGEEVIGIKSRVKVSKNKVAAPFREAEVDIMFSPEYKRGFSLSGEVLDFGVKDEFIRKAGAFYSYGDVKLGQGRENVKKFLEKNPELLEQIRQEIMKKHISTFITSGG